MDAVHQYPIIIKKKIPYLSEFFLGVASVCLIITAICFFLFMPSLQSSNEMKVVATVTIIPEYVKWLILYYGIGLLIFWFLYKYMAVYKTGLLSFNTDILTIKTKTNIYQVPISNISRIELIDPVDYKDDLKGKFIVVIYKRNADIFQFRLKEYNDCFSFIDTLLKYDILTDRIKNLNKAFLSDTSI